MVSGLRTDLHLDPVGINHVEPRNIIFERLDAVPREILHRHVLVVTRYSDREMVDYSGRAFAVERDKRCGVAKANDVARRLGAHDLEAEHFLVEFGRTL